MKIGILGSGFNPPHYGHLLIASQVMDLLKLDEVWLMPVFSHPFNKELLEPDVRLQMTKYLESDKVKVSDYEIKKGNTSYTYDTLESLSQAYPTDEFFFIIGEDQLKVFKKWKNWEELVKKYKFVVFPREVDIDKLSQIVAQMYPGISNFMPVSYKDLATTNISSSMIRHKIKKGESIKYLVPEKVEEYIVKNNLYR